MSELKLFDYLNSVNHTKEHLLDGADDSTIKGYPPFIANLSMSLRADTIMFANDMNMRHQLPAKMNYDYYFYGLEKAKRFAKWPKKQKVEEAELVAKFYNVSVPKAMDYMKNLTDDDLELMRQRLSEGGKV